MLDSADLRFFYYRENGKKPIDQIAPGFFDDPRHLALHFEYLTESPPLNVNIEKNLKMVLEHLELYLTDINKAQEAQQNMLDIQTVCEVEFAGSSLLKDLHLMVTIQSCENMLRFTCLSDLHVNILIKGKGPSLSG